MWDDVYAVKKGNQLYVTFANPEGSSGEHTKAVIPSDYYPLKQGARVELFSNKNCCDEVVDADILDAFDSVPYKRGHCYQNCEALNAVLTQKGYKSTVYAGWLFFDASHPIHHAWVILKKGSHKYLLDLSDDFTDLSKTLIETEDDFIAAAVLASRYRNRIRCSPVGIPSDNMLYVGCPCEPEEAKDIWNNLIERYPDHISWAKNTMGADERLSNMQVKLLNLGVVGPNTTELDVNIEESTGLK